MIYKCKCSFEPFIHRHLPSLLIYIIPIFKASALLMYMRFFPFFMFAWTIGEFARGDSSPLPWEVFLPNLIGKLINLKDLMF